MQTVITARHCQISDALRDRAQRVVDRLSTFASRPMEATVVFDTDGTGDTVELRLHVARGQIFVATGSASDHRTALDRAEEKLRRQLEKEFGRPPRRSRPEQPPVEV